MNVGDQQAAPRLDPLADGVALGGVERRVGRRRAPTLLRSLGVGDDQDFDPLSVSFENFFRPGVIAYPSFVISAVNGLHRPSAVW